MLTDSSNKIFSILKNTPQALILRNGEDKFIRKTYILSEESLKRLIQRKSLSHSQLIGIYQIEYSHTRCDKQIAIQIVFEHYCNTLEKCIQNEELKWEEEEIINTFLPILEVIEYLHNEKVQLTADFTTKNIVVTQKEEIKYIDQFLLGNQIHLNQAPTSINNFNKLKIYENVAQTIFQIMFPLQATRSWKNRTKLIKQTCSPQFYTFIQQILSKSLSKGYDSTKTKKIKKSISNKKKQNIQDVINKCQSQRNDKQIIHGCHNGANTGHSKNQGKENILHQ